MSPGGRAAAGASFGVTRRDVGGRCPLVLGGREGRERANREEAGDSGEHERPEHERGRPTVDRDDATSHQRGRQSGSQDDTGRRLDGGFVPGWQCEREGEQGHEQGSDPQPRHEQTDDEPGSPGRKEADRLGCRTRRDAVESWPRDGSAECQSEGGPEAGAVDGQPPEQDTEEEWDDDEPTGVLLEAAIDPIYRAVEPGPSETRAIVEAALDGCAARGITGFHDMVRDSHAPRVYRDLDAAGELTARVRINYWSDHLDAAGEVGLATNAGSDMVETGAIKSYTDGSFGGRTARLSEPYADAPDETGQWVVAPDELNETVAAATEAGFQFTAHAIGDEAVDAVLDAYEDASRTDAGEARHRVEHAELADDEAIERFAATGAVASVQPNFLKWAQDGGLYEERLGPDRTAETNRYRDMLDAGVRLAFGSDGMPMDPLFGVHHAVNAPAEAQRLTVTEALRAYTSGAAYAGFDEDRLGTVEVGKRADLVALDASPWERADAIDEIDVALTVVDGDVVFDGR